MSDYCSRAEEFPELKQISHLNMTCFYSVYVFTCTYYGIHPIAPYNNEYDVFRLFPLSLKNAHCEPIKRKLIQVPLLSLQVTMLVCYYISPINTEVYAKCANHTMCFVRLFLYNLGEE